MKITIAHLYPEILNLYGDKGNIASFEYRLKARNIDCEIISYDINDDIDFENTDIIFIGGGNDNVQNTVCTKLLEYKEKFESYAENGGCVLAVCGGMELLGKSYKIGDITYPALEILDFDTVHDSERHIGNIVIQSELISDTIVGFENHSGIVNAGDCTALGTVISGFGNDGKSCKEGFVYKNVIATYMHGPLLPKNPKLTDYILTKALEKKYGEVNLAPLDDTLENTAHDYAVKKFS